MASDFHVTIHGARGKELRRVLGTDTFDVRSPVPVVANLPGKGEVPVYLLDLDSLTPDQFNALVAHLAGKFHLDPEEVRRDIHRDGVPILYEDCSVMVEHPQRWF